MTNPPRKIALIGFGEAAMAFAGGWRDSLPGGLGFELAAYDIKTDQPATAQLKRREYSSYDVAGADSHREAVKGADVVFSLVTADESLNAGKRSAGCIDADTLYYDCNSVAPSTKLATAALITAVGGRYIDAAIMSPVHPKRHKAPILLSGPHAKEGAALLEALDMDAGVVEGETGAASSIKMIRSIMIKGLEALTAECVLAGRKAGVEEAVLDTLQNTYPGLDWRNRAAYNFERVLTHGVRRAAEMEEVVKTIEDLGLASRMSQATIGWQQQLGTLALAASGNYGETADDILQSLENQTELEATR